MKIRFFPAIPMLAVLTLALAPALVRADDGDEEVCPGKVKGYLCMTGTAVVGVLGSPMVSSELGVSEGSKGSSLGIVLSSLLPTAISQDLTDLTLGRDEEEQVSLARGDAKSFLMGEMFRSDSYLGETIQQVRTWVNTRTAVDATWFSDEQIALAIYLQGSLGSR